MSEQPNVILIITDQQRADTLSCYGSKFTATPSLDRLAAEGVLFERAYCANAVCTPSRTSIFSGLHVSRHGIWNVGMNVAENIPFLSHYLGARGYHTQHVGKAHFQSFDGDHSIENRHNIYKEPFPYYGFDAAELAIGHANGGFGGHYGAWIREWVSESTLEQFRHGERRSQQAWGGEGYDWDLPTALHSSAWVAERALTFLKSRHAEQPFFLSLGFEDPHHPHYVPKDYPDRVLPESVLLPDYEPGELDDKPPFFAAQREGRIEESGYLGSWSIPGNQRPHHFAGQGYNGYLEMSEEETRIGRAYYYTMVRLIDDQVGRILDCLDERGLAENTLIIFTSDHGELLGDHGLWRKGPFHYEQLLRIPMIMRWPAGCTAGQQVRSLVSHVDIVPSVLEAAGESVDKLDGLSFLPVLNGEKAAVRQDVLVETVDAIDGLRLNTIVTEDRKLTCYAGHAFGELYDLADDPGEKRNLWHDPRLAPDRMRLLGRLVERMDQLERYGCNPRAERIASS